MNDLDDLCRVKHKDTNEIKFISGRVKTFIWLKKNPEWRVYEK